MDSPMSPAVSTHETPMCGQMAERSVTARRVRKAATFAPFR